MLGEEPTAIDVIAQQDHLVRVEDFDVGQHRGQSRLVDQATVGVRDDNPHDVAARPAPGGRGGGQLGRPGRGRIGQSRLGDIQFLTERRDLRLVNFTSLVALNCAPVGHGMMLIVIVARVGA